MKQDPAFFTSTFSVAGRCETSNAFGAIVTTSSPAVGARVVQCKSNTGVVLTQNMTDPRLAELGMSVLDKGYDAASALNAMKAATPYPEYRQLAVVDKDGLSKAFTGDEAFGPHNGQFCAPNVVTVGNFLGDPDIPEAMGQHFLDKKDMYFPERLLSSLEVGFDMGGEVKDEHSIALVMYTDTAFPYIDLRIDYSENPFKDMMRLWEIWKEKMDLYKQKALNPAEE